MRAPPARSITAIAEARPRSTSGAQHSCPRLLDTPRWKAKPAGSPSTSNSTTSTRPLKFGGQYLTYVLWAITPEGRAVNLGEVLPGENGKDKINVTTELQAFGLIVTAEPYFSVTHPSNEVVAENVILQQTKGFEESIDAKFDVLEGNQYTIDVHADQLPSTQASPGVPLDLLEARNAVAIAKAAGAVQYASDSIAKAEDMLQRAEDYYQRKQGRTPIGTAARGATQMAEDARVLSLRRQEQNREAAARQAAADAQAKAEADAAAAQQREQQAQAQAAEDARRRADAEQAQAAALAQQQQAQAQADAARLAAADADRQRQEAVQQKEALRARLLAQLNQVLQTRDTARGLIVSMPDVLFDFDKYTLKPDARERLAKISGIVLAYPDLKLQVEGHTDSIGTDDYNQTLSEKRAETRAGIPGLIRRLARPRHRHRPRQSRPGRRQQHRRRPPAESPRRPDRVRRRDRLAVARESVAALQEACATTSISRNRCRGFSQCRES